MPLRSIQGASGVVIPIETDAGTGSGEREVVVLALPGGATYDVRVGRTLAPPDTVIEESSYATNLFAAAAQIYNATTDFTTADTTLISTAQWTVIITALTGTATFVYEYLDDDVASTYIAYGQAAPIVGPYSGVVSVALGAGVKDHVPGVNAAIYGGCATYGFSGLITSKLRLHLVLSGTSPALTAAVNAGGR